MNKKENWMLAIQNNLPNYLKIQNDKIMEPWYYAVSEFHI